MNRRLRKEEEVGRKKLRQGRKMEGKGRREELKEGKGDGRE